MQVSSQRVHPRLAGCPSALPLVVLALGALISNITKTLSILWPRGKREGPGKVLASGPQNKGQGATAHAPQQQLALELAEVGHALCSRSVSSHQLIHVVRNCTRAPGLVAMLPQFFQPRRLPVCCVPTSNPALLHQPLTLRSPLSPSSKAPRAACFAPRCWESACTASVCPSDRLSVLRCTEWTVTGHTFHLLCLRGATWLCFLQPELP